MTAQQKNTSEKKLTGKVPRDAIRMLDIPRVPQATIDAFLSLGDMTSTVSDAMDEIGLYGVVPASRLRPTITGARIVGPAITLRNIEPAGEILEKEGLAGLIALPGIGESLARSIAQIAFTGRLELLDGGQSEQLGADWRFHVSDGYTPGQLLPEILTEAGPLVFAGDLVPGTYWLQLDVTSGHDRNPESLVEEKEQLLDHLVASRGRMILARDPQVAMIRVTRDRQARYQAYDEHSTLLRLEA